MTLTEVFDVRTVGTSATIPTNAHGVLNVYLLFKYHALKFNECLICYLAHVMKTRLKLIMAVSVMFLGWIILIFNFIHRYNCPDYIYTYDSKNQPTSSQLILRNIIPKKIANYIE